jgi:pimeloyl-ACP methyl ester carboxylesterase
MASAEMSRGTASAPQLGSAPLFAFLHGFASSPGGLKAQRFARAFAEQGIELVLPDLNLDLDGRFDFAGLTLTRQLAQLDALTSKPGGAGREPRDTVLIGSSFGGYASALFAAREERVRALILLAPAFDFAARWSARLGQAALEAWQRAGNTEVMHYATKRSEALSFALMQDAKRHPPYPEVEAPTLVFHGKHDQSVDCDVSLRFVENKPNAELLLYETDHGLHDVVDDMIARSWRFLRGLGLIHASAITPAREGSEGD